MSDNYTKIDKRDRREVFYSEKLKNLSKYCNMRHCTEKEFSTGWLCYDLGWYIEFECPLHGIGGSWSSELDELIKEVVRDAQKSGININQFH